MFIQEWRGFDTGGNELACACHFAVILAPQRIDSIESDVAGIADVKSASRSPFNGATLVAPFLWVPCIETMMEFPAQKTLGEIMSWRGDVYWQDNDDDRLMARYPATNTLRCDLANVTICAENASLTVRPLA